jgi:hypothetical protein
MIPIKRLSTWLLSVVANNLRFSEATFASTLLLTTGWLTIPFVAGIAKASVSIQQGFTMSLLFWLGRIPLLWAVRWLFETAPVRRFFERLQKYETRTTP